MAVNPLKKSLRNASRDAIGNAIRRLHRHISLGRWVGLRNIYAKAYEIKPHKKLSTIRKRSSLKRQQARDYIAASIFNHCGDGWSLLGRALNLHIKGDSNSSVHLAYYAELRAAMSLLGSEGIGVLNRHHLIVTDTKVELTSGALGTHKFTWTALEHWANRKLSAETLGKIISPGSITLSDWSNAFSVSGNLRSIGCSWLKLWGIDIKHFGEDQVLRNNSSYRPSRILPRTATPASDSLAFLSELWHMCEPNPSSRFEEIDRYLLRESLAHAYQAVHGVNPRLSSNINIYRSWVEKNIPNLHLVPAVQSMWVDFLTWRKQPNDSRIIKEAGLFTSVDDPNHHLQVLARATLLLRIATGISGNLLRKADFTKEELEFWWGPYAVDHGLIGDRTNISDFLDLWDDIDVALQDISAWETSQAAAYSYNDLVVNISQQIFRLSECERITLWGLGI